jgi:CheY-like chemotaxis protein
VLALTYGNSAADVLSFVLQPVFHAGESRVSKKPHTILVVEDVDEISESMSAALKQRGHRVECASNADQAIQMAEENRPAMILTDLDLPTFDSLMSLLRAHTDLKNMLVAIIDINGPKVSDQTVNIVCDFQALDDLIESSPASN